MKHLKRAASYVFVFGLFYLAFAYLAKFNELQSVVLAVIVTALWEEQIHPLQKTRAVFSPYQVTVLPHWPELLADFKLIDKPEEWESIKRWTSDLPPHEYCVLRSGITFTVVQEGDSQQTLIYQNDHQSFLTRIDFEEIVKPLEMVSVRASSVFRSEIGFFMLPDLEGYGVGINVPSSWWEKVRADCPKPQRESEAEVKGRTMLQLATIPSREFREAYREDAQAPKLKLWIESENRKYWDERDQHIAKFGWNRVDNSRSEWGRWAPDICLKHKYFSVMSYRI